MQEDASAYVRKSAIDFKLMLRARSLVSGIELVVLVSLTKHVGHRLAATMLPCTALFWLCFAEVDSALCLAVGGLTSLNLQIIYLTEDSRVVYVES